MRSYIPLEIWLLHDQKQGSIYLLVSHTLMYILQTGKQHASITSARESHSGVSTSLRAL